MKNLDKNMPISERIFKDVFSKEFEKLRKTENTIFENSNISLDIDKEYQKFKNSDKYQKFIQENSEYEKRKIITDYFFNDTIIPLVETVMFKAENLSFSGEIILENTYDLLLKKKVKRNKIKKDLKELNETSQINSTEQDEQIKYIQNLKNKILELNENEINFLFEESIKGTHLEYLLENDLWTRIKSGAGWLSRKVQVIAKNIMMGLNITFSAAEALYFGFVKGSDALHVLDLFDNLQRLKTSQKTLKKSMIIKSEKLDDFLRNYGNIDLGEITNSCWEKNRSKIKMTVDPDIFQMLQQIVLDIKKFINGMMNPNKLKSDTAVRTIISTMKRNDDFNRMIHLYRQCIYDNIIDFVISYAETSLSIGQIENNLLKRAKQLKQANDTQSLRLYNEFYNFTPKNTAEKIFIESIGALVDLKLISYEMKKNADYAMRIDHYIKEDQRYLESKLNQAFATLYEAIDNMRYQPKDKNYEESNRDNKAKVLMGNEPTQPKKISVFDV